MKKLLFSSLIILAVVTTASSQCTPDLQCSALVCPDTITNLPHAQIGVSYTTTMTVVVPADTNYAPFGVVTIDTLKYVSISGLPAGFTAIPNNPSGWPGNSIGCLLISGTTSDPVGTYPLTINISVKIMSGAFTLPLSLTGYKIIVEDPNGFSNINFNKFSVEQNTPNPFSNSTIIEFTAPKAELYHFSVISVIGEEVYSQNINAVAGSNNFEFLASDLPAGVYMYKLSNKTSTHTKRMIIKK